MTAPAFGDPPDSVDWMRIFATRLARGAPRLSADDVVRAAIAEYARCAHLPPEQAASLRMPPPRASA